MELAVALNFFLVFFSVYFVTAELAVAGLSCRLFDKIDHFEVLFCHVIFD